MTFQVHAFVKNADDLDRLGGYLAVENDMSASTVSAIAIPDVATVTASQGFRRQILEALVQHGQIIVPLRPTPMLLSVATDPLQVSFGRLGEVEMGHQLRLSLSSSSSNPWRE